MFYLNDDSLLAHDNVYVNKCKVSEGIKYHAHNFIEIAYVAKGEGYHIIDGEKRKIKSGNITVINYDVPHAFKNINGDLIIYNCIFTPQFLDRTLSASRNFLDLSNGFLLGEFYKSGMEKYIIANISGAEKANVLNIYEKMLNELNDKKMGYCEIIRSYLINLLITVFRIKYTQNKIYCLSEPLEYIHENYNKTIKNEELAEMACLSSSAFCRKFKKSTGFTVTDFIQRLRIEEACNLLVSSDFTVEKIANKVGYEDMKHFYDIFKRVTGKLPSQYRKRLPLQ